jgi:hypothetical protein
MLHEGERLAYLQALGIAQYVPLRPIAGVSQLPAMAWESPAAEAVSPEPLLREDAVVSTTLRENPRPPVVSDPSADVVAQAVSAAVQRADPTASTTPQNSAEPAQRDTGDIPQLDLSKLKPVEEKKQPVAPKAASLQRFTLAVITLPQRARLLVELSQPEAPGLSGVEFRLLSDLLLALNCQQEIGDSNTKLFRWPLVNNPRIAADVSAARDGLLAFLSAAQSEQPLDKVLFLGVAPLVCFPHQQAGEAFTLPELDGASCLLTYSLAALQKDWTLKPIVWRQLQSFL